MKEYAIDMYAVASALIMAACIDGTSAEHYWPAIIAGVNMIVAFYLTMTMPGRRARNDER